MPSISVLITGASSGIGRALALACAAPGARLHLSSLDRAALDETDAACRARGAEVAGRVLDVNDEADMADWIAGIGQIDLVVANAGIGVGSIGGEPEDGPWARAILATNVFGMLNTTLPAMQAMAAQAPGPDGVRGRIAVLASIAAYVTVPGTPAYCASKAAVDAWAVGNAPAARRRGIVLTSVCPGYVRTPMTAANTYRMAGLMEPAEAARRILRGVATGRARVAFPWWMAAASRLGSLLPPRLVTRMVAGRG